MRRQGPKVRKVCWLVRIGSNFFCRLAVILRVICEQKKQSQKKVTKISPTVGQREGMCRQGPRVGKVCWLVRIGLNFFCRLAASLRVICER